LGSQPIAKLLGMISLGVVTGLETELDYIQLSEL